MPAKTSKVETLTEKSARLSKANLKAAADAEARAIEIAELEIPVLEKFCSDMASVAPDLVQKANDALGLLVDNSVREQVQNFITVMQRGPEALQHMIELRKARITPPPQDPASLNPP